MFLLQQTGEENQPQEPIPRKGTQMMSEGASATEHLTKTLLEQCE